MNKTKKKNRKQEKNDEKARFRVDSMHLMDQKSF